MMPNGEAKSPEREAKDRLLGIVGDNSGLWWMVDDRAGFFFHFEENIPTLSYFIFLAMYVSHTLGWYFFFSQLPPDAPVGIGQSAHKHLISHCFAVEKKSARNRTVQAVSYFACGERERKRAAWKKRSVNKSTVRVSECKEGRGEQIFILKRCRWREGRGGDGRGKKQGGGVEKRSDDRTAETELLGKKLFFTQF